MKARHHHHAKSNGNGRIVALQAKITDLERELSRCSLRDHRGDVLVITFEELERIRQALVARDNGGHP